MTDLKSYLEDFATASVVGKQQAFVDESEIETVRLESYESGYRAGWDDAVSAQSDDKTRISSAFGQHLQDLSFTYHEAYSHVMNAMTPLLEDIVGTVLPEIARATLGAHLVEELRKQAESIGTLDVLVAVAPSNAEAVAPLFDKDFGFPVRLTTDATLAEQQADIRFGDTEWQVDLGQLVTSVTEAVQGFAHENHRKVANG